MHRYLNSVANGGNLDPAKNTAAINYIPELKNKPLGLKPMLLKYVGHRDKNEKLTQTY
jgi:hypothetical protein